MTTQRRQNVFFCLKKLLKFVLCATQPSFPSKIWVDMFLSIKEYKADIHLWFFTVARLRLLLWL